MAFWGTMGMLGGAALRQAWRGAAAGAATGLATGLIPGGQGPIESMLGGAMAGGLFGGLAGAGVRGGFAMAGRTEPIIPRQINRGSWGARFGLSRGGTIGMRYRGAKGLGPTRTSGIGTLAGGLAGLMPGRRNTTIQSNAWAGGSADMMRGGMGY